MADWLEARASGRPIKGWQRIEVACADNPPPADRPFLVRIRRPRSLQHHRLLFGMLKAVCEATGRWPTAEHLLRWLKVRLGYYTVTGIDGYRLIELDSIDFMAMAQDEFRTFFDLAVAELAMETGCDPLDLVREAGDGRST